MDVSAAIPEIDMDDLGTDFSDLPEPIIHQIMSLLPTEDSTRLSAVSKSCLLSWRSFPILDFDLSLMESKSRVVFTTDMFLNFVIRSLNRRALRSDLQRLSFRACLEGWQMDRKVAVVLQMMVNFALQNKVKDLFLHLERSHVSDLPIIEVFSSKSIKKMSLSGLQLDFTNLVLSCPLMEDFSIRDCDSTNEGTTIRVRSAKLKTAKFKNWRRLDSIHMDNTECLESFSYWAGELSQHCEIFNLGSCKSLKTLKLHRVPLTDEMLENLVSQLVSLEILKLKLCKLLKNLHISKENLKIMSLEDCKSLEDVDVAAQNLEVFRYSKQTLSANRQCNINLSRCVLLKDLQLIGARINVTHGWTEEEISTPGFQFLERLKIEGCKFLKKINFYAEHLKHLELLDCGTLRDSQIDAPNLVSLVYGGPVLPSTTVIFSKFQYAELHLSYLGSGYCYYRRFMDLVTKFGYYQTLTLVCDEAHQLIVPLEKKETFVARLFDLKHLNIELKTPTDSIVDLISGLLWLAPHPETISITMDSKLHAKFKFYYKFSLKSQYDEDDATLGCCLYSIKCWRHFLTRIEMEIFKRFNQWESLQSFFIENAKARITTSIDKID